MRCDEAREVVRLSSRWGEVLCRLSRDSASSLPSPSVGGGLHVPFMRAGLFRGTRLVEPRKQLNGRRGETQFGSVDETSEQTQSYQRWQSLAVAHLKRYAMELESKQGEDNERRTMVGGW